MAKSTAAQGFTAESTAACGKRPFVSKEQLEAIAAEFPTPFHLYSEHEVRRRAQALNQAFAWNPGFCEYFAVKATPNPSILKILMEYGCGADCATSNELLLAHACGLEGEQIMLSSNDTPAQTYLLARDLGAIVNFDSYDMLEYWRQSLDTFPKTVCCRVNPGGDFQSANGIIGSPRDAKFGMTEAQLHQAFTELSAEGVQEFGIHAFLASNTLGNDYYPRLARQLFQLAAHEAAELGIHIGFIDLSGGVGVAYELVKFDPAYEQIVANLLGRTVVAESLSDAIRMSRQNGNRLRIVTLDGQLINAGGSMTGGSSVKNSGILSRANELEKLRKQREKVAENERKCSEELERARSNQAAVRYQLDMALEDQAELRSRVSSFEAEQRTTENNNHQLQLLLDSLTGDSDVRRSAVEAADRQIEGFRQRLREKEQQLEADRETIRDIREEIDRIAKSKLELEGKRTRAEKEAQNRNAEILDLGNMVARLEQKKLAADMEEKQILDKLWENYELSHTTAEALRQPVESLPKANKEIAELRRQINALGTPNLGAIEEYGRVNSRYEFLSEQRDDVEKAKKELLDIIRDITGEMETVFLTQFKAIDAAFRETFLELFGGGKAALVLEDETNVLECGIEIKVQPPGKALSTISLMSGGEMAFVAIALYFAILKVRPTPFCVMDEIEAALDEANVSRYASYMRRMAGKTQFLVITHRRGTMEEADMLYGVTMQEKGVSTVLELDLETAQKTIEE